jgi:hypothetical protein
MKRAGSRANQRATKKAEKKRRIAGMADEIEKGNEVAKSEVRDLLGRPMCMLGLLYSLRAQL